MACFNLISCINNYTRISINFKSCLDHIFINNHIKNLVESYIIKYIKYTTTVNYTTVLNLCYISPDKNTIYNFLKY